MRYLTEIMTGVNNLNFCDLVVGVVGLNFSPTIKSAAEKSFDVETTSIKICRNKRLVSNVLFITE